MTRAPGQPTQRPESGSGPAGAPDVPAYDLSVVIACYQERPHLEQSVRELTATLDASGRSYELIFLDDASTDGTAAVVAALVAGHANRRAVYHQRNVGRGGTVSEGFRLARGRIVGFLDIDLEVHCRHLPDVLAAIDAGADGATAFRNYRVDWSLDAMVRHVLSRGYRRLFRAMFDVPFADPETGFKFFVRERILPVLASTRDVGWFWDTEIMVLAHQAGLRLVEVPCRFERRSDKKSTVRVGRDVCRYLVALRAFRRRLRAQRRGAAPAPADAPPR